MAYQVLSRKYRPRTFDEVVGQSHIVRTLKSAIEADRLSQAYIFSGTRGTGKTTMARILAKALNCVKGPAVDPCNECDICKTIDSGDDVDVIEIDGASHTGVDNIRELRANAAYRPARARFKIYYIDEVHMLSTGAFNALLKTLEEPPSHVKFIFSTTEPHKIPLTIQSRCQRFDFRTLGAGEIVPRLEDICRKEGIDADDGAFSLLARLAAGSMRDAESLLDQAVSFCGAKVRRADVEEMLGVIPTEALSDLLGALVEGQTGSALEAVGRALSRGMSARQLVAEFVDYLRDALVAKECGGDSTLIVRSSAERELLAADAAKWSGEAFVYAMQLLSETHARMARGSESAGLLDVSIIKLSRVEDFIALKGFLCDLRQGKAAAPSAGGFPGKVSSARPLPAAPVTQGAPKASGTDRPEVAAVLDEARSRGNLVAQTLTQHAEMALDGDVLKIFLPWNFKVQKGKIEEENVRQGLEAAASKAAGRAIRIEIVLRGAPGGRPGGAAAAASPPGGKALRERALSDGAVRKVLEVFGGSLIDVIETEE